MKPSATTLALGLLLAGSTHAQAPVRIGEQFQVNSYTTSYQALPAVAAAADGDFVIVWHSLGSPSSSRNDGSGYSIQAQRYDAAGTRLGSQFQVNTYTLDHQIRPAVAADALGSLVIVWQSRGSFVSDNNDYSIQGRLYDATGTPVGEQFQVNSYTGNAQRIPAVAVAADGSFVVVWDSDGSYGDDTDLRSIQAQRYDAGGIPIGGEFEVNSYTTSYQAFPAVAARPDGSFLVVWESLGPDATDDSFHSIQAQLYDASGTPFGGQFQINSYTSNAQRMPAVAADADGNFVVIWGSDGSYGNDIGPAGSYSIQGQRYDANGLPVGSQFQVNSYTSLGQDLPKIAADARGTFLATWRSPGGPGNDTSQQSIQAQFFSADGAPAGPQFQVNSYTTSYQYRSAVAADGQGNFVVVWESEGSYGTDTGPTGSYSIQGQRYSTGALFVDGFESGDTAAWSSAVT